MSILGRANWWPGVRDLPQPTKTLSGDDPVVGATAPWRQGEAPTAGGDVEEAATAAEREVGGGGKAAQLQPEGETPCPDELRAAEDGDAQPSGLP